MMYWQTNKWPQTGSPVTRQEEWDQMSLTHTLSDLLYLCTEDRNDLPSGDFVSGHRFCWSINLQIKRPDSVTPLVTWPKTGKQNMRHRNVKAEMTSKPANTLRDWWTETGGTLDRLICGHGFSQNASIQRGWFAANLTSAWPQTWSSQLLQVTQKPACWFSC